MPAIISGKRRGAKLIVPEGLGVRPTLNRVREALFSMLFSELGTFEGCDVLDPFAGAGMLGLEAWSRGASHVDFVEQNRQHFTVLKKNIETLRAQNEVTALLGQTPKDWYRLNGRKYDLVLCDPPYAEGLLPGTLEALVRTELLKPGAIVSIEMDAGIPSEIPEGFEILKDRKYGKCRICLVQLAIRNS
ncbi:MAG: 16S rRNA (guanine(966)-N(2))-methyltransferase RsmD [Proteobacteria bacterium]|nr:16S rRNA (guanine(966)-N(2))-methyltransferase RsmD [Pseudomonadota bacterium]